MLLIVLIFRSFFYEPFQIPSGSMMPTLLVGDFILVQKFSYGIKDPIFHKTFFKINTPNRGDVVVFRYPKKTNVDFIKRVIGLPNDKIVYDSFKKEFQIYPNYALSKFNLGFPIIYSLETKSKWALFYYSNSRLEIFRKSCSIPLNEQISNHMLRQTEKLEILGSFKKVHKILLTPGEFPYSYFQQSKLPYNTWIVPPKHYFVVGDNRDNSFDSRMWGFVPEENLVGKAVFIWLSLNKVEDEWPIGVRFSRFGKMIC